MGMTTDLENFVCRANGARTPDVEQTDRLMANLVGGDASDVEAGAFAIAMRMNCASKNPITGPLHTMQSSRAARASDRPVVVVPGCSGTLRLPNLAPPSARSLRTVPGGEKPACGPPRRLVALVINAVARFGAPPPWQVARVRARIADFAGTTAPRSRRPAELQVPPSEPRTPSAPKRKPRSR